jgi:hypothetical protein
MALSKKALLVDLQKLVFDCSMYLEAVIENEAGGGYAELTGSSLP